MPVRWWMTGLELGHANPKVALDAGPVVTVRWEQLRSFSLDKLDHIEG